MGRARSTLDDIIQDDIPQVVRIAAHQSNPYLSQYQEIYSQPVHQYQQSYSRAPQPTYIPDDLTYRMRPNTEYVINREYSRYQPAWSWTDFATHNRQGSPYSGRDSYSRASEYKPVFNQYLTADYQPSSFKPKPAFFNEREPTKERTPFFLQPILPRFGYNPNRTEKDIPATISSHANLSFPFRKYRSDFVPYAPYKSLHDSAKYSPNPDWLSFRPWGYRFRKARYVYVPEEENSSKSVEIERIMREARLRELVKGVYSSTFGDSVTAKVTGKLADRKDNTEDYTFDSLKSVEAEAAVTQGEVERRKPLTAAEKRRRNETLAIGISRTELLKSNGSSEIGIEGAKSEVLNKSCDESIAISTSLTTNQAAKLPATRLYTPTSKEPTPPNKKTIPQPKEPTPPQKDPIPQPNKLTPSPKEPTPPPKDPTPPPKEPTPPPKEPTPPPKEPIPTTKELTPTPKEPTPTPKEPTPTPKEQTPPPKEPTQPPRDITPPPKEPTPPPKELTPPPRGLIPSPKEPTPPLKEPTPPPGDPTSTQREYTPPYMEPNELTATYKETTPPLTDVSTQPVEPSTLTEGSTPHNEVLELTPQKTEISLTDDHTNQNNPLPMECEGSNENVIECTELNNDIVCDDRNEVKDALNENKEPLDDQEIINAEQTQPEEIMEDNDNENNYPICNDILQIGGVSEASNLEYETVNDDDDDNEEENMTEGEVNCEDVETVIKTVYTIEESNGFEEYVEET